MYYIQQKRQDDCGFTSLKMLLASLNKDENYLYLKENKVKGAYSFNELVSIAKTFDVELEGFRFEKLEDISKKVHYPYLLTLEEGGTRHLVLVKGKLGNIYHIYDPKAGRLFISKKKLEKKISGTVLIIKNFKKKKAPAVCIGKLKLKDKIILNSLRLSALVSIILSALFIDKVFSPFLPLILLFLGLAIELLYRIISLRYYKKLDSLILDHVEIEDEKHYDYYKESQKYKSLLIENASLSLFAFALFGFLFYLITINDYLNLIPFSFTLLFVFFEILIIKPKFNKTNQIIEKKEKSLLLVSDMERYKVLNDNISKLALKGASIYSFVTLLYSFTLVALLILNMSIKGTFQITYVIFYYFLFSFIKKIVHDIFLAANKKDEEKMLRAKLVDATHGVNDFQK